MTNSSSARPSAPPPDRPQDGDVLDLGDGVRIVVVKPEKGPAFLVLNVDGQAGPTATARAWAVALETLTGSATWQEVGEAVERAEATMGRRAVSAPTMAEVQAEVAALRQALDTLRSELATEVRTRSLVVVDAEGHERIHTNVHESLTQLYVDAPRGAATDTNPGNLSTVSISAAWNEVVDDLGRPMGSAGVTCWSKGTPGATLVAEDVDGHQGWQPGEPEHDLVVGTLRMFDRVGSSSVELSHEDGLRFVL